MNKELVAASRIVTLVNDGHNLDYAFAKIMKPNLDEALIKDICYGSLRNYYKYDYYLSLFVKKKIEDELIKNLLINSIYQLINHNKKEYTLVDNAVEASKQINSGFKAFVNAVLRNYLRQRKEIKECHDLKCKYSYPNWWIEKIQKDYKENWKTILEEGNTRAKTILRINNRKLSQEEYIKILVKENIEFKLILENNFISIESKISIRELPGFNEGMFSIQDPAAQLACDLANIQDGMSVLDVCSAPGGKATHMLERFDIEIDCVDINKDRINVLNENLARLQLVAKVYTEIPDKKYDRIVVDAPCTASGIVKRHIEIKYLRALKDIKKFQNQQFEIVKSVWDKLKKGGELLYITCSVFYEENEMIVEKIINTFKDAKLKKIEIPNYYSRIKNQLLPNQDHDGLFYAAIQKK